MGIKICVRCTIIVNPPNLSEIKMIQVRFEGG